MEIGYTDLCKPGKVLNQQFARDESRAQIPSDQRFQAITFSKSISSW